MVNRPLYKTYMPLGERTMDYVTKGSDPVASCGKDWLVAPFI
jgi:hypothetical protein